jgi:tRNA pseudouridine65 synthase
MKHISHPIIGDAKHGKGNHNRFFQEQFTCDGLMLASTTMEFIHPITNEALTLTAPLATKFTNIIRQFGWESALPASWITTQDH